VYNRARNIYYHSLKVKKTNYYVAHFEMHKNNLKETWKSINKILEKKN